VPGLDDDGGLGSRRTDDVLAGIGGILSSSCRSLLGRTCLVTRVFSVHEGSITEIGASGDRLVVPRPSTIRDQALLATTVVTAPMGRPAGFRVAEAAGWVKGHVAALVEAIGPTDVFERRTADLSWLGTVAALAIHDLAISVAEHPRMYDLDSVRLSDLTPRERQVLTMLTEGATTAGIAHRLGISRNTARTHVQNIRTKLGVGTRLEAAALAMRLAPPVPADEMVGA
jgi:DNA-binding CsgD family transcriptional regulator